MKKIILFLTLSSLTLFCSCSKDDDKAESVSLEGTTWVSAATGEVFTYKFTSSTQLYATYEGFDANGNSEWFEEETLYYTYTPPKIIITDREDWRDVGKISENNMIFDDGEIIFIKQ